MKHEDFEIYYGLNRYNKRKAYLVFSNPKIKIYEMQHQANKFFKRPTRNVILHVAYILKDELYLEYPDNPKAKAVTVAYFI